MPDKSTTEKANELLELESLLERDLRRNRPALGRIGVTRDQLIRSMIRLGVSSVLLLAVYFLGLFRSLNNVAVGILLVAMLEALLLFVGKSRGEDNDSG